MLGKKKYSAWKTNKKNRILKRNRTKIIYAVRQQLYRRYKIFDGKTIFRQ